VPSSSGNGRRHVQRGAHRAAAAIAAGSGANLSGEPFDVSMAVERYDGRVTVYAERLGTLLVP
jgi:hypothetical protein